MSQPAVVCRKCSSETKLFSFDQKTVVKNVTREQNVSENYLKVQNGLENTYSYPRFSETGICEGFSLDFWWSSNQLMWIWKVLLKCVIVYYVLKYSYVYVFVCASVCKCAHVHDWLLVVLLHCWKCCWRQQWNICRGNIVSCCDGGWVNSHRSSSSYALLALASAQLPVSIYSPLILSHVTYCYHIISSLVLLLRAIYESAQFAECTARFGQG